MNISINNDIRRGLAMWRHGGLALMCAGALFTAGAARANSVQLNFKYTVVQGTCDVQVQGMTGGVITVPDITPPASPAAWVGYSGGPVGAAKDIALSLNNCSSAAGAMTPGVTVKGALSNDAGAAQKLFRDASSTSTGFGFVIYNKHGGKAGDEVLDETSADPKKYISIPGYVAGQALPGATISVPLSVAVTCGACSVTRAAGTLAATVTFSFGYH